MTVTAVERELTALDQALERGAERLLELQHPDGWWKGELESNATMIAQHLFWHHFVGLRRRELDRKIANELLARQRSEEHTSELQSPCNLVCRLLLEKKKRHI